MCNVITDQSALLTRETMWQNSATVTAKFRDAEERRGHPLVGEEKFMTGKKRNTDSSDTGVSDCRPQFASRSI
jgi:hypothetical protein